MPVTGSRPMTMPTFTKHLEEDHRGHAAADEHRERVGRPPGADEQPPDQQGEQDQDHHGTDEAELFGEDAPHEVGRRHGQGHVAVGQALAGQPSGIRPPSGPG